ncbi:hypothetical protein CPC08DRAFT_761234 [Agrocybe pediades]|nr:hypothetical protein CPC08DRAFT_761234 [Agrocybe pediades]
MNAEPRDYSQALPVELWRECFEHLSMKDYKELNQTCRFFNEIAKPFVFKRFKLTIEVRAPTHEFSQNHFKVANKHIKPFVAIANDPSRASCVREIRVAYFVDRIERGWKLGKEAIEAVTAKYVDAFVDNVPKFIGLRRVIYGECQQPINKRMLAAVASLPLLDEATFNSARFGLHKLDPRFRVCSLSIENYKADKTTAGARSKTLDIVAGDNLEKLCLRSTIYSHKIFASLTALGECTRLRVLKFQLMPQQVDVLYNFLACCPNLETLCWEPARVHGRFLPEHVPIALPPLPPTSIPRLRFCQGPAILIKLFVRGRPLDSVAVDNFFERDADFDSIIHAISQTSRPVVRLFYAHLKFNAAVIELIASLFPGLTRLFLEWDSTFHFNEEHPSFFESEVNTGMPPQEDPEEMLQPTFMHDSYMRFIHWVALGQIKLPAKLEKLYLDARLQWLLTISHLSRDDPRNQRYSVARAKYLFSLVSKKYPAFKGLVIGEVADEHQGDVMAWLKHGHGASAEWRYHPPP